MIAVLLLVAVTVRDPTAVSISLTVNARAPVEASSAIFLPGLLEMSKSKACLVFCIVLFCRDNGLATQEFLGLFVLAAAIGKRQSNFFNLGLSYQPL